MCGSRNIVYLCDTPNECSKTPALSHYICNECGSVFVGNDIGGEELGVAYSTLDAKAYYEEIEAAESRNKMAASIGHLKDLISANDSVIDIGTGNGLFVELLTQAGFQDVSAHEIQGSDLTRIEKTAPDISRFRLPHYSVRSF